MATQIILEVDRTQLQNMIWDFERILEKTRDTATRKNLHQMIHFLRSVNNDLTFGNYISVKGENTYET